MIFYLLWCLQCEPDPQPDNAIPFESPAARGAWAAAHFNSTSHTSWHVLDQTTKEMPA